MDTPYLPALAEEIRHSGHWVVGRMRSGKTNLLLQMACCDIANGDSVIVLDAKGELTQPLMNICHPRLIVLDPEHTPFALNPLQVSTKDLKTAVSQVEFIFNAMIENGLTDKQRSLLRSLIRASIMAFPNPTILTLYELVMKGPA